MEEDYEIGKIDGGGSEDALKLSLYLTLKNLYEKWFMTYSQKRFALKSIEDEEKERNSKVKGAEWDGEKSEFSSFLYVDSFYNDISNKMLLNPETLMYIIKDHRSANSNYSVYDTFYSLCKENKLLFITLPVYNNYYDGNSISEIFLPQPSRTMKVGDGATYICMYTHQMSHILNNTQDVNEKYEQDGFDIADITGGITQEAVKLFKQSSNSGSDIKVPAFGVTYARQNQSYFTNITVNMDSPKLTDFSIQNQFKLAKMITAGNGNDRPLQLRAIAQDAYSVFSNQSYTCTVEMLGCMNIMPMMYFQLNNIPMFRGAYMIISVEHNVKAGGMTTKFTGVRVSKIQLPYNRTAFTLAPYMNEFTENIECQICNKEVNSFFTMDEIAWKDEDEQSVTSENGIPNNQYLNIPGVISNTRSWVIPDFKPKSDDDKDTLRVMSEDNNHLWTRGRTYQIGVDERGFSRCGIISWISNNWVIKEFKEKIDFEFMITGGRTNNQSFFFDYPEAFGFKLCYTANTINEVNEVDINNTFRAGDIAKMRLVKNGNSSRTKWHYCMWDGIEWVSDHKQGTKICDLSGYSLYTGDIIRVYRFSNKAFEESTIYKKIMESKNANK